MSRPAPDTPTHVDGVELTEAQRSRLGRLILCIWIVDDRQTGAGCVAYAEMCFAATVRRADGAFIDRGRVPMGGAGRSVAVS